MNAVTVGSGGFPSVSRLFRWRYAPTSHPRSAAFAHGSQTGVVANDPDSGNAAGESGRGRGFSRADIASWLEGPGAAARAAGVEFGYRGQRLGLPEMGPGSVGGVGRRVGALFLDWFAALFVTLLVASPLRLDANSDTATAITREWATLIVFAVTVWLGLTLASTTLGKRLLRLQVVRVDGTRIGAGRAAIRTLLLCLVIPALIWDRDGRGLHDKAVGSVVVRT